MRKIITVTIITNMIMPANMRSALSTPETNPAFGVGVGVFFTNSPKLSAGFVISEVGVILPVPSRNVMGRTSPRITTFAEGVPAELVTSEVTNKLENALVIPNWFFPNPSSPSFAGLSALTDCAGMRFAQRI